MKKIATFIAGAMLTALPAFAHHQFAEQYDWKKPVTVTGSVAKVEWGAPHTVVTLDGKDSKGNSGTWTVEMGPRRDLTRYGWDLSMLKEGDKITVDGWGATDGSKKVNAKSVTTANGREMFAASSFFHLPEQAAATSGANGSGKSTVGTSGK